MRRTPCIVIAVLLAAGLSTSAGGRARLVEELRGRLAEAELAMGAKRYDRAADLYRGVIDDAGRLARPNRPLARALDGLADVLRVTGRPAESVGLYLDAAEMWEALFGPVQPRLATTLHNLGVAYVALGEERKAAVHLRRALDIWVATLGADSSQAQNTASLLSRLP